MSRDFKGGEGSRDPIVPVAGDKQREALKFCVDSILSDQAFQFSPALLRRLTTQNWYHWGSDSMFFRGGMDYPIYSRILGIQRIVLNQCFNGGVLSRLQNQELKADASASPLRVAEVFKTLTDGIWSELNPGPDGNPTASTCSTIRRNLQREHLRRLCTLVLGARRSGLEELYGYVVFLGDSGSAPADARSLARLHLQDLGQRIDRKLELKDKLDDALRAHLAECRERITKVLEASFNANEP